MLHSQQVIIVVIHSFIADICIAPLQVGLLRSAPKPNAADVRCRWCRYDDAHV